MLTGWSRMAADTEQELAEFNSPVDADKPSTPKPLYDPSPLHLEEATYPNSCLLSFFFSFVFLCLFLLFSFWLYLDQEAMTGRFCIFSSWWRGGSLCDKSKYPFSIAFNLYFIFKFQFVTIFLWCSYEGRYPRRNTRSGLWVVALLKL